MENMRVQKKKSGVTIILAFILILTLGGTGIWLMITIVFPLLQGFFGLKMAALVTLSGTIILAIYWIIRQFSLRKPGLIIDQNGITDQTNVASVGLIPWHDIIEINEAANELNQKLIIITVQNPDNYFQGPAWKTQSQQAYYKQFGSPVVIHANHLDHDYHALMHILKHRLAKENRLNTP